MFDRKLLMKNINFLLKESNLKISDIEAQLGVSIGYLSRLSKSHNVIPSIEIISLLSDILSVNINSLLYVDLENNPTKKYLFDFISKLILDTDSQKLNWIDETESANNIQCDKNNSSSHPLFSINTFFREDEVGYPSEVTNTVFFSHYYGYNTYVNKLYYLKMKGDSTLNLLEISKDVHNVDDKNSYAKEIWMNTKTNKLTYLIGARESSQDFIRKKEIDSLFYSVENYMKYPKFNNDIKNIIDDYIKKQEVYGNGITKDTLDIFKNKVKDITTIEEIDIYFNEIDAVIDGYYVIKQPQKDELCILDIPSMVIKFNDGSSDLYLNGCNCGYGGEGPHGSETILKQIGIDEEKIKQVFVDKKIKFIRNNNEWDIEYDDVLDNIYMRDIYSYNGKLVLVDDNFNKKIEIELLKLWKNFIPNPQKVIMLSEQMSGKATYKSIYKEKNYNLIIHDQNGNEIWFYTTKKIKRMKPTVEYILNNLDYDTLNIQNEELTEELKEWFQIDLKKEN